MGGKGRPKKIHRPWAGGSNWLWSRHRAILLQMKLVTGANCSSIIVRCHLQEKGFKNAKHLQQPRFLQRHKIASLEFALKQWDTESWKKALFSDEKTSQVGSPCHAIRTIKVKCWLDVSLQCSVFCLSHCTWSWTVLLSLALFCYFSFLWWCFPLLLPVFLCFFHNALAFWLIISLSTVLLITDSFASLSALLFPIRSPV